MIRRVVNSKSKTFLAFCFCFLVGNAFVSLLDIRIDPFGIYLVFVAVSFLSVLLWQKKNIRSALFCFLFFTFGAWRFLIAFPLDAPEYISYYNGEERVVTGHVSAEPDIRSDGVRYIIKSENIHANVYLKSNLYPRYRYGDVLEVSCDLKAPEPIEDFRYDMYLARFGVFSICANPRIQKIGDGAGNGLMQGILSIKNTIAEKINLLWPEPHASFMAGLLYGYRGGLGSLNDLFARTGVTHIVAISGYNITIVATILITICIHLLIPRQKAFWLVTLGIILFVLFAGASASVVRAGVMGVLVLVARQMGRMSRIGNVLVLTALIMTLHNPFVLMWDAGFQLSFLSTVGLVYLAPIMLPRFQWMPEALGLQESVVSTISATVVTLPLILFQFGRLSIVAVIVNVLILWIIPFIMMIGFAAVLTSFLFLPIARIISWIAWIGLEYIIQIVMFFAKLPFAAVDVRISFWLMCALYMGMFWYLFQKTKKHPVG